LIASLGARLEESGIEVTLTREPGGTALGKRVRAVFLDPAVPVGPHAEAFLLNASRAQLVSEVIRPALRAGRAVLCDRYTDATLAYQGFGRGLNLETLRALCDAATGGLVPDATLLLDLPIEVALDRLARRGHGAIDRVEREDAGFHRRVRDGYLALAKDDARFAVLDATLSAAALLEAAWHALASLRAVGR
jgi:dTMP kinase